MRDARDVEPLWRSRLRWRMRGAVLWPAVAVLTVLDALLLGRLPIAGDGGTGFVPALLLAMFFNLVAVAVGAPLLGRWLRRRRNDLPKVVADDYAGTGLVLLVTGALLAGGVLHHSAVRDVQHDLRVQQASAREYARGKAPRQFRRRSAESTTVKVEDELFRTCVPGNDPARWYCMFVSTNTMPPRIVVDESRESNASFRRAGGFR
jgi:hypothetical protein